MQVKINIDRVVTGLVYFFMISVPLYIWLILSAKMSNQGINYCLSDAYCFTESCCKFYFIPLVTFIVVHMLKYNFRQAYVIRMKNIRTMWLLICARIMKLSFCVSMYMFASVTLIGSAYGQFQCNWTSRSSSAYAMIHMDVINPPSVWEVMASYFVITFLIVSVTGIFITFLWWISGTPLIGYATTILLLKLEVGISPSAINLFFAKVNLNPAAVYYRGINYPKMIIYPSVLLVVLIFTGFIFIRRKDFLKKE